MLPQENNHTFTKLFLLKFPQVCSAGDYFKLCISDFYTLFNSPVFTLKVFIFKNKYLFLTQIVIKGGIP